MKKLFMTPIMRTIGVLILAFILMILGEILGALLVIPTRLSESDAIKFLGMYFMTIGTWIVGLLYCWLAKKNRDLFSKLWTGEKGNNIKTALILGLPFGIGLNLLSAAVAWIKGDIVLYFNNFNPVLLLLFLFAILIQGGSEELICRWFIYEKVKKLFPDKKLVPIVVNALFFGALHLPNPGITIVSFLNIILIAVLYSLLIYYFDSFWACVVAHGTWNFCQNILLGLPNSGIVSSYSLFGLEASTARDSFAYNVGFGIEGTLLTDSLILLACVIIVILGRKAQSQGQKGLEKKLDEQAV